MNSQEEKPGDAARHPAGQPVCSRKEYAPPTLVVYGNLAALTAGGNDGPNDGTKASTPTT
jgi:hypothetical protein